MNKRVQVYAGARHKGRRPKIVIPAQSAPIAIRDLKNMRPTAPELLTAENWEELARMIRAISETETIKAEKDDDKCN